MTGFWNDVRYAIRQLGKNPGFTTVAVLTLALGVAANTVIFTVMNATILKRLPFPESDRHSPRCASRFTPWTLRRTF